MTSQTEQKPSSYYEEIHQYFLKLSNFLSIATAENSNANQKVTKDRSNSVRAQKARAKLLKLSPLQFYELCTDVTDELNRRVKENETKNEDNNNNNNNNTSTTNNNQDDKSKDYLLPKLNYHVKRNQARQKLSNLSQLRFNDLIDDILFEMRRRGYHIIVFDNENIPDSKTSSPGINNSQNININGLENQENGKNDLSNDNNNTEHIIDSSITVPLPSVIQSSLVIPQKASIDWSEEEEEEEEQKKEQEHEENKSKTNSSENMMINKPKEEACTDERKLKPNYFQNEEFDATNDNELDTGNTTEDLIRSNSMKNPFNSSTNNTINTVSEGGVINIPGLKSNNPLTSPSDVRNTTNNEESTDDKTKVSIGIPKVYDTNHENVGDNQSLNEKDNKLDVADQLLVQEKHEDLSMEPSKQGSNILSPSVEQPTGPSLLQSPSSISHLQNELIILNKQLTSLSIENEKLKTKISELEVMNSSQQNLNNDNNTFHSSSTLTTTDIEKNNYVLSSLKHENISQFIKEYGIIPETLIVKLYNVVNELYTHIDSTRKNSTNLTNITNSISFGKMLFQLINQFYSIILKIIDLLTQSGEKDTIVLLKSTFSNLITTSKYFALYYRILPNIAIISSINECIFIIMDIINILKVKRDTTVMAEDSSKETNIPSLKISGDLSEMPLTTSSDLTTTNHTGDINSLGNSPVKPLRIIEKVASSPLITGVSNNDSKTVFAAARKPSNNVLLSLTSMVKKNSTEKLIVNKGSKNTKNSEIVSDTSANMLVQRNTPNLVKKMAFNSSSTSSSSDSESNSSNDDDNDTHDLLQELKRQKEEVDSQLQEASSSNEDTNSCSVKTLHNDDKVCHNNLRPVMGFDDKNTLEEKLSDKHELAKEKLVEKESNIPRRSTSNESDTIPDIEMNNGSDLQVSQPNIKANFQPNFISSHNNESTSDAASYATTNNELPSEINVYPSSHTPSVNVISSSSSNDNVLKPTSIQKVTDIDRRNSNFESSNIQNKNENLSINNSISSEEREAVRSNNDDVVLQSNKRADKPDEPTLVKEETYVSSKVGNSSLSHNPTTNPSLESTTSPIIKPFKITKLESRSLKKVNLSSKDINNEGIPGLGITLGESTDSSSKANNMNKVETRSELSDDKEMELQSNDKEYDNNRNTYGHVFSNTISMDKKKEDIVINENLENTQMDRFDALENKPSNIELQNSDKLKMPDSHVTNEESLNENYSRQPSVTIHPLESMNQQFLEKKDLVEGNNNQYNDKDVDSRMSHDSLDLNQTKDDRELADLEETLKPLKLKQHEQIHGDTPKHSSIEENLHHISDRSIKNDNELDNDPIMDDDSFQTISSRGKNVNDLSKEASVKDSPVSKKEESTLINKVDETKMANNISEDSANNLESGSEEESGTESSESESATASDSDSDFESGSDSIEGADYDNDEEDEEEVETDFDVEAFDIENPDNTLSELLLYLEHQTVQVITTIQSLLSSIKQPKSTKGNLRTESNAINQVIKQMVGATSISMNQSRNANLKEHGSWVVQSLEDCSRRMITLCQLNPDGEIEVRDNDTDYADKNFKQRLAGIAFDIAKCTKELVKTVEEASLKEEIEYLNSKIRKE